jgi:tryptophan-rich sensory protein
MTEQPERPPSQPGHPLAAPLWLLLFAVVGFGSYLVWREADNRRIARGDLTPWERMEILRKQRAEEDLSRRVDQILGIPR